MSLLGLDLNATRLRAVRGPMGDYPRTTAVDPPRDELPLVASLQGRHCTVGAAGLRLCRAAPHLAWHNFLPQLGGKPRQQKSNAMAGKLDAGRALGQVFQQVVRALGKADGMVLALPPYLSTQQVEQVSDSARAAGLPVLGSVCSMLAAALAAHAEQTWFSTVLVVDVDDQALTVATVDSEQGQARLLDARFAPQLNQRAWQERLLNALADCCILDSRWDPRSSPAAEQALFDQLGELLEAAHLGRATHMAIQTPQRYQKLVLQPHDPAAFCASLRRQAIAEVAAVIMGPWPEGAPRTVLLTAAAARLPGLAAGLRGWLAQLPPRPARKRTATRSALEDFGNSLLDDDAGADATVVVLTDCAPARGVHALAGAFLRGDIPRGHLGSAAPLPLPQPLEAGPARLHFQGKDYFLGTGIFAIGNHPGVDLMFDGEHWPGVSARHCEIIYDHRTHMLCDRSRDGTLVNDRPATQAVPLHPGDWIRLGPDGPLLRFLGQTVELRTTA